MRLNIFRSTSLIVIIASLTACSDSEQNSDSELEQQDQAIILKSKNLEIAEVRQQVDALKQEFSINQSASESKIQKLSTALDTTTKKLSAIRDHVKTRQAHFEVIQKKLSNTDPDTDELSMTLYALEAQLAMDGKKDIEKIQSILEKESDKLQNSPSKQ